MRAMEQQLIKYIQMFQQIKEAKKIYNFEKSTKFSQRKTKAIMDKLEMKCRERKGGIITSEREVVQIEVN